MILLPDIDKKKINFNRLRLKRSISIERLSITQRDVKDINNTASRLSWSSCKPSLQTELYHLTYYWKQFLQLKLKLSNSAVYVLALTDRNVEDVCTTHFTLQICEYQ